jgi:hypothetical protein
VLVWVLVLVGGQLHRALEQFEQACKLSTSGSPVREIGFGNWRTLSRSFASLAPWAFGYPTRGATRGEESLAVSREIVAYPSDLIAALYWSVLLNLLLRDPRIANPRSDEIIKLAHEHSLIALSALHEFTRGWCLVQIGQIEEGPSETRQAQTELRQFAGTIPAALYSLITTLKLVLRIFISDCPDHRAEYDHLASHPWGEISFPVHRARPWRPSGRRCRSLR